MKIISRTDDLISKPEHQILAQGAELVAVHGDLCAGLWFSHTPVYQGERIGTIGACRLNDSSEASDFLASCADYLHQEYGRTHVVGPMNGNTWLPHRLILENNGRVPFQMEPVEPDYFYKVFDQAGFDVLSRYSSSTIDLTKDQRSFQRMEDRVRSKGVNFRSISHKNYQGDLESIHALSLTSFANNFLYTPLPLEHFLQTYTHAQELIDPDMVILAERESQLVGFVFCMPDRLTGGHAPSRTIIVKTLAAMPEKSLAGLGTVLVAKAQQAAKGKGYSEAIHALQHENNTSLRISQRFDATVFRRYALMVKSFA